MKRAVVGVLVAGGVFLSAAPFSVRAAEVDAQDVLMLKQSVENQSEAIDLLKRRVAALESKLAEAQRDTESLKRANSALTRDLVTQDQLRVLAGKVEQVDVNRSNDSKRIFEALKKIADAPVVAPPTYSGPPERRANRPQVDAGDGDPKPEPRTKSPRSPKSAAKADSQGDSKADPKPAKPPVELPADSYQHVVKANETVSEILIAYRKEYGLKTTMAQLEAANPGLNPKKLKVDQKINIPIVK